MTLRCAEFNTYVIIVKPPAIYARALESTANNLLSGDSTRPLHPILAVNNYRLAITIAHKRKMPSIVSIHFFI